MANSNDTFEPDDIDRIIYRHITGYEYGELVPPTFGEHMGGSPLQVIQDLHERRNDLLSVVMASFVAGTVLDGEQVEPEEGDTVIQMFEKMARLYKTVRASKTNTVNVDVPTLSKDSADAIWDSLHQNEIECFQGLIEMVNDRRLIVLPTASHTGERCAMLGVWSYDPRNPGNQYWIPVGQLYIGTEWENYQNPIHYFLNSKKG